MENKTKLILLETKELIYTGIFVALGIILIIVLVCMFHPGKDQKGDKESCYKDGTYTSNLTLGENSVLLEVTVENGALSKIKTENTNETITTMYPLLSPAIENINKQLQQGVTYESIDFDENYQYTGMLINQGIESALEKAK